MAPSSNARKAISRLVSLLNDQQHPYKPSTQIFLELDAAKIAADIRLAELGSERGAAERPQSDAKTYDDVEHRIIERLNLTSRTHMPPSSSTLKPMTIERPRSILRDGSPSFSKQPPRPLVSLMPRPLSGGTNSMLYVDDCMRPRKSGMNFVRSTV